MFVATWPGRITALVLIVAVGGGATLVARSNAAAPKAEVRTATVTRGSVTQTVSVSGSVNALGQARLAFKTGGKLATIYVTTGQAVTLGQPLAKLDTADLETTLATTQQSLANAQASYQKQLVSASDTRASLSDTEKSTASDIANAQTALNKIKTNYTAAKANFTSLTNSVRSDVAGLQTSIDTLKGSISAILLQLSVTTQTGDVRSATSSLTQAQVALNNATAYSQGVLVPALTEFTNAQYLMPLLAAQFDIAISAGSDTSAIALQFQTQQLAYNTAASRVSSALDTVTGPLSSAQTNAASAQTSVNSTASLNDPNLDPVRDNLRALQVQITTQTQAATTTKSRITQAGSAASTISDALLGSYASAVQALSSAQDRAATSLRNAQSAVANIPFNLQSAQVSVDNANSSVATAKTNLDNTVLTAPAAGIVASITNQVGEFVSGGNTNSAFIVLTNITSMVLHGTIGESDVAKLKLGQVANVTVDAITGQRMTGKVTSLDPVATISQGVPVYGIDIAIDVPASGLKAGMSASAAVILASKQNVLTVPNTTIRTVNGKRGVQVLKGGEIVDTAVTFGLANDTVTEVVSGLAEGDTVVIPQARAASSAQPNRGVQIPGAGGLGR
ncbi:MAG: efflux RND transporter periplasmic adaptor subunit [Candidatus Limnocylindria bacterium]|nr:efflux RND transporter periplasmic adaptor subunit [Candidatus Limnocylindria bacterium]